MGKRLNDISAVQAMNPYESQNEHYSKTVRKIDNGYIVHESHYGPNCPDGPTSKEVFVHEHPSHDTNSEIGSNAGAMKRAVDFMNKR